MKQKDALTDIVEHVQGNNPPQAPQTPTPNREVVNNAGETITLGQENSKTAAMNNKGNVIELQKIQEIVTSALEKAFDRAIARFKKRE